MEQVKLYLDKEFSIKELGSLKFFIGIEVARSSQRIILNQIKYTLDIIKKTRMQNYKPSKFSMEHNCNLRVKDEDPNMDAIRYQGLLGRFLYLTITRLKTTLQ
uniref:Reverse transcriptase Ty1/copia-type domain-containing protein n=1 Tax=Cajanus cajan TaxID=3821 RepID=A0A151SEM1_CAJCA|nr:hypothetical protein KK1_024860 [Cajanus cajan]